MERGPSDRAPSRLSTQLRRACGILAQVEDVVRARVGGPQAPGWCRARGWEAFLAGLTDPDLARCEAAGLVCHAAELGAPSSLVELARAVRETTEPFDAAPPLAAVPILRGASPRKRGQIAALVGLCLAQRRSWRRIVDVGAGRGHLTRELTRALGIPAVGLELDAARVRRAEELTGAAEARTDAEGPRFHACDAGADLRFREGDLAIGLHACGRLGDALITAAARDGVDLILINCCLQKIGAARRREPLSAAGRRGELVLAQEVLGLTNLTIRPQGVERSTEETLEGRTVRLGLRLLLRARGDDPRPGQEMRGLHRRLVPHGLEALSARAFALRGWPPPPTSEIEAARLEAKRQSARIRRFSLPRNMLGRLLEVAIVLDRACALEEAGRHRVSVEAVFPQTVSSRNLGVVGWGAPAAPAARRGGVP